MDTLNKGIFFVIISYFFSSLGFAASDGTLGSTSQGSVTVTLNLPALVQITGLSDITLSPTSSTTYPITGNTTACIYSNAASPLGNYFVTASSANASATNTFRVKDVATGTIFIVYSAFWNNTAASSQTTTLLSGQKSAQQLGGDAVSFTCADLTPAANANFNISFADTTGKPAGTYKDTVTILISPV